MINDLLAANLRKARKVKELSQEYVAGKLGISQSQYSDIENGKVTFPIDKIESLSKFLEIQPT